MSLIYNALKSTGTTKSSITPMQIFPTIRGELAKNTEGNFHSLKIGIFSLIAVVTIVTIVTIV
ncbi:MAG: hypothetical protein QM479_11690, partial [Pseudomonadota bacterium]